MQEANPAGNLKKLAAIPVLIIILVYAIQSNGGDDSESTVTKATTQLASINKQEGIKKFVVKRDRQWPELELDDLLSHNPFSNSLLVQESKEVASSGIDSNLIEVNVYLSSESGTLAMAGETIYRVGDILPDGRIVDSLTNEHIYLKRLPKSR